MSAIKAYDSAYPGSMHDREDGYYLCRNDHASLAAALVELIASRDREIEDFRVALAAPQEPAVNAELLEALQNLLELYQHKRPGVWGESLGQVKAARAAIAKAGGAA